MTERRLHKWDDDGICIHCGHDGAEAAWLQMCLRAEIGDDEFQSRKEYGDFDADRYCENRDNLPDIRVAGRFTAKDVPVKRLKPVDF